MKPLKQVIQSAAADRDHGAGEIERRLVAGLLDRRDDWTGEALAEGADVLRAGQPVMANLRNLARRLATDDPASLEAWLRRRAEVLDELPRRLGEAAWPHLEGAARLVTLSRSSAVAAVLEHAWDRGWRGETVVLDGSPAGRGPEQAVRLARRLQPVRSQPDATAPRWLDGQGVRVVVGADAVSPKRLVNVCGTAALLELAGARSVPVVVVADTGKELPDAELDELLAASPRAGGDGPGRSWPLFESAAMAGVAARVHE